MSQHRINGPSAHHKPKTGHSCHICGKVFATHDDDAYEYKGKKFCYIHIVKLSRMENTLFPKLSCVKNGFDLEVFCREISAKIIVSSGHVTENTVNLMDDFVKNAKLDLQWLDL